MSNPSGFPRRIDPGNVASYTWEYGGECRDVTGNGNTGTLRGDASVSSGVLTVSGAGDVDITGALIDPETQDVSYVSWFLRDVLSVDQTVIGANRGEGNYFLFGLNLNPDNTLRGYVRDDLNNLVAAAGTTSTTSGNWYHGALTWNSSTKTARIYLDGALEGVASNGSFGATTLTSAKLAIGRWGDTETSPFDGQIGETRIYNRALTADEIGDIYRETRPKYIPAATTTGLEAWYRFYAGANDATGANDGTLVGDSVAVDGVLTLDGTGDYVTAPVDISGYSAITLTGWIQFDDINGVSGTGTRLFSVKRSGVNDEIIRCGTTSGGLVFSVFDPGTTYGGSTITAVVGTWYFMSMVWDSSGWSMRLDNSEFASGADSFNLSLAESTLYLGVASWTQASPPTLDGDIGETRIYNRALTATEITDIFNDTRRIYYPAPIDSGLESWYQWNGNANDTTGANDGTLTGGATASSGLLTLDGTNDYVDTGFAFGNGLSAFTVSAWVKADSWTGSHGIIGGNGISPNRYVVLFVNNGGLDGTLADGSTTFGCTTGATTLSTGVWYHICYTFSGGSITGYIDTVVDANYPQATGITAPVLPVSLYIGARNHQTIPTDLFFDGQMGEVRLYSKALTESEIADIYQTGLNSGLYT